MKNNKQEQILRHIVSVCTVILECILQIEVV